MQIRDRLLLMRLSPDTTRPVASSASRITLLAVTGKIRPVLASTSEESRTACPKSPVKPVNAVRKRFPKLCPLRPRPETNRYWNRRDNSASSSDNATMQLRISPGGSTVKLPSQASGTAAVVTDGNNGRDLGLRNVALQARAAARRALCHRPSRRSAGAPPDSGRSTPVTFSQLNRIADLSTHWAKVAGGPWPRRLTAWNSLGGVLVVFLVYADRFQIVCLEYLVTVQAAHVVDPVTTCQNFSSLMLAGMHTKGDYFPILVSGNSEVKTLHELPNPTRTARFKLEPGNRPRPRVNRISCWRALFGVRIGQHDVANQRVQFTAGGVELAQRTHRRTVGIELGDRSFRRARRSGGNRGIWPKEFPQSSGPPAGGCATPRSMSLAL